MLCTAVHCSMSPVIFPCPMYQPTHVGHCSARWVRHSLKHFQWTIEHGLALCDEYTRRYGKRHKCHDMYLALKPMTLIFAEQNFDQRKVAKVDIPAGLTFIVLAINDDVFDDHAAHEDGQLLGVRTYRNYYKGKESTMKRKMTWR